MKTNLFKVKEKKEKRIIIEEERLKNPFLLFLKRHKAFILTSGIMLGICLLLVSTGLAFSLFRGSNDYDITYIEGDEIIDTNQDPSIDDEDIKEEFLGEIARTEGIVLQTKTFMTKDGDVISYFTDFSAIVVKSTGKIYRISSVETNKKESYNSARELMERFESKIGTIMCAEIKSKSLHSCDGCIEDAVELLEEFIGE